ncbi:hypothetical protein [Ornithinibacillus contaminans]|uniref:hypothetical protein n=1 Tax=Ornithinibacillus contaminans TaxID=694055 RepID=UPI00064E091C|nr:hypothetical protein [Ornithinibacillus contaminans]
MSVEQYYNMCCRYKGRAVQIRTHDGRMHRGVIRHVSNNRVYLHPIDATRNLGGFSYPFGYGYGYGGFGAGIALGAIATLALIPFFFW